MAGRTARTRVVELASQVIDLRDDYPAEWKAVLPLGGSGDAARAVLRSDDAVGLHHRGRSPAAAPPPAVGLAGVMSDALPPDAPLGFTGEPDSLESSMKSS